jgi:pantetheine-phosphate adenylyltransferase
MSQASITAVFSGTFDPLTLGHADVTRRAARLFGRVIVAVAAAHHKNTRFTQAQRLALASEALADCPNVLVQPFDGLIVDFCRAVGAQVIVRSVRNGTDFDYETQMAAMNRKLAPELDTVLLAPAAELQCISGTLVREIAKLGGDIAQLVPANVHAAFKAMSA